MPCTRPISAYRSLRTDSSTSSRPVFFKPDPTDLYKKYTDEIITLRCGLCPDCKAKRARDDALRCAHESTLYTNNSFLTLTYNKENIPAAGSLCFEDIQLFFKRLRKQYGKGIRYFQVGEYGGRTSRPHYHVLLFNHSFSDLRYFKKTPAGSDIYLSKDLDDIWKMGYCSIGAVNFNTASYTARYVHKKLYGKLNDSHYEKHLDNGEILIAEKEKKTASNRPGIGFEYYQNYKDEIWNTDSVVIKSKENYIEVPVPKYYDVILKREDPTRYRRVCNDRVERFREWERKQEVPKVSSEGLTAYKYKMNILEVREIYQEIEIRDRLLRHFDINGDDIDDLQNVHDI